jgi:diguanylate cyclase (GGDEF)-like protein
LVLCACAIAILGVVDYVSGGEIVLSVFYVMPVALAAWVAGRTVGTVFAAAASAAWFLADHYSLGLGWSSWVAWWNGAVRFAFFVLIALVVAALRHALLEERELARLDPLTGAYIDVDDFKRVNDGLGHAVGDEVLATIATELTDAVRRTDMVARLGGDEFAVVLPEADAAVSATIFERVLHAVEDTVMTRGWPITLSVGTVTCPEISQCSPGRSGERLVSLADEAMYEAKQAGKNTLRQREVGALIADGA